MLKIQFHIILFLFSFKLLAQQSKNNYDRIVYSIKGDLNNDAVIDWVTVKEDPLSKFHPYLLEIKFGKNDGTFESILTSEKAVMEKYPEGDERTVAVLENLQIKKGLLIFTNQLIRSTMVHKFRYQNGNFELIGYTSNDANPGYFEYVDYNLSNGQKITKKTEWETNKLIEKTNSKEKMLSLPKLQDFTPIDFTY